MRIQVLSHAIVVAAVFHMQLGFASDGENQGCFNFQEKIAKPLPWAEEVLNDRKNVEAHGKREHVVWASVRGTVEKPLKEVLELLFDPEIIKGEGVNETKIDSRIETPLFLRRQIVQNRAGPFIHRVRWKEDWVFSLISGKSDKPEQILVSYQKSEGTSFIKQLCGNIVLRKLEGNRTDVFQYEQVNAKGHSSEDSLKSIKKVLERLRGKKSQ
ncbi:MAG: hypothetical protein AB1540_17670 [Bdellovibrionota bacterium]